MPQFHQMDCVVRITDLPPQERPRERLFRLGPAALSNAEILALLLRTGSRGESVIDLARRLFSKLELSRLPGCDAADLTKFGGIKDAKACQIVAAFELARRAASGTEETRARLIKTPEDVVALLRDLRGLRQEQLVVVCLGARGRVLRTERLASGGLSGVALRAADVFGPALKEGAHSIVLAHNHPSGDAEPSEEDIRLTKTIFRTGKLLGIRLLDHVIICDKNFSSLAEMMPHLFK